MEPNGELLKRLASVKSRIVADLRILTGFSRIVADLRILYGILTNCSGFEDSLRDSHEL